MPYRNKSKYLSFFIKNNKKLHAFETLIDGQDVEFKLFQTSSVSVCFCYQLPNSKLETPLC
jgi:hypothetical protein